MAKVAPLILDLDCLARELTASRSFADLLNTHPTYRPTMRVDVDIRYAWLAAAFDRAVAKLGQMRRAWTPVYTVTTGKRRSLPAGVYETAEEAVKAWARANKLRYNRSNVIVDRQRLKVAQGWTGLQAQLEDGLHVIRLAEGGETRWAVPALVRPPEAEPDEGAAMAAPLPEVDGADRDDLAIANIDAVETVAPEASSAVLDTAAGALADVEPRGWAEDETLAGTNICPHCGEPLIIELAEVWGNDFMIDACCEGMHEEVVWTLNEDPEGAQALLRHMEVSDLVGRPVRSVCDDGMAHLVLNFELRIGPIRQKEAKRFINDHHTHNEAPVAWRWGGGIYNGDLLMGVVWVGRPVARALCQTTIVEVNRLCFRRDYPLNMRHGGCSMAYRWAEATARERGFLKIVTYTLEEESGYTLRAARWKPEAKVRGKSWNSPSRPRVDKAPTTDKVRWAKRLVRPALAGKPPARTMAIAA